MDREKNCRVIAVANQKGGVGKTVTCVNLGIGLAREGKTNLKHGLKIEIHMIFWLRITGLKDWEDGTFSL